MTPMDESESGLAGVEIRQHANVLAKRVEDVVVLVHLETNCIFELNRTAAALWDILQTGPTRTAVEEALARQFDVQPEILAHEVEDMLERLAAEQLIVLGG